MFGVSRINAPAIQPLSEFLTDLREGSVDQRIVYGAIYISTGHPLENLAVLRYVKSADDFQVALAEIELLIGEVGDRHVLTDSWIVCAKDDANEAELLEYRGVFEAAMGFHFNYPAEELVPQEKVVKQLLELIAKGATPGFAMPAAKTDDPTNAIEDLLKSIDGKSPDDFKV